MSRLDLVVGTRYGRLTVLGMQSVSNPHGDRLWNCRCDCGSVKAYRANALATGNSTSCGCLRLERANEVNTTHGASHSDTYSVWMNMKQRILNPHAPNYKRYGGRGITICDSWLEFTNFLEDMGCRPDGMILDRIDNNGPYCKENCHWTTPICSARNTRRTVWIEWNGENKPLMDWADKFGIHPRTLHNRFRRGCPLQDLFRPVV